MNIKKIIGNEVSDKKNSWMLYQVLRIIVDENDYYRVQIDSCTQNPVNIIRETGLPFKKLKEIKRLFGDNKMVKEVLSSI